MSINRVFLAGLLCLTAIASATAQGKRTVIGILPVYDNSAQLINESLAPNLTYMIYRDLLKNPAYQPVLLSPGGLYDPDAVDWISEYAAKAQVDVVLISSILPSTKKNERRSWLTLEVQLLNVANGKVSAKVSSEPVEIANVNLFSNDTIEVPYVSPYSSDSTTQVLSTNEGFTEGSRAFGKHPLGKAARKLVDWADGYFTSALSAMEVSPTGPEMLPAVATCDVNFHIRYVAKKSVAKSYTIIANNKEESSTIDDGTAHFPMQSGPLFFRVQVRDAPYGMRIVKLYQASTILDCSASSHNLVMEMGNAGDALLRWQ
jgi:hypothetical protein